jgi:hypothetical protein
MKALQSFGMFVACLVFLAPQGSAQDLARYRDFEFGMTVDSVMKQMQAEPSNIKTVYTKPNLIQTLQWNRQDFFPAVRSDATDPVVASALIFMKAGFSGSLRYTAPKQLEGMSSDDLIEGISKTYGAPDHARRKRRRIVIRRLRRRAEGSRSLGEQRERPQPFPLLIPR